MSAFSARHPGARVLPSGLAAPRAAAPWLALLASMLWYGGLAWLRPLALPDEGRYVGVAWEMLRSGQAWVPMLDGMPYFHKPPLFYWITAAAMQAFGASALVARAAPWLGAVATTAGLFLFVRRWVGEAQAWTVAAVLATLPLFFGGAQFANLDMLVAACIALTILAAAHATLLQDAGMRWRAPLAAAYAFAAAGVLAKGLIGVVLPGLVLIVWALLARRTRGVSRMAAWWPGWCLLLAIAAPWFVAMQSRYPGFLHYFFVVQHFERFTGSAFNNGQPMWFYPAVLLAGCLPWWPWLLRRGPLVSTAHGDVRLLMMTWAAGIVVFFSLPHSKLVGYVLPALAPLAALIGDAASTAPVRRQRATLALAAFVCVAGSVAAHYVQPKSLARIGATLQAQHRAGEPVVFIGSYYFDVPFYARLDAPAFVVDAWTAQDLARDSWRRELVDAQAFARSPTQSFTQPFAPRSTPHLLHPAELDALLCGSERIAWIVGPWPAAGWLNDRAPVQQLDRTALWRIDTGDAALRGALACEPPTRTLARITPRE